MASTVASSHPFTCNTCQVAFRTSDLQRTHMQSDWHRYNLKRRVASLPPLSSEVFAEKVLANQASAAATAARASYERACELCAKTYYSENAYINHLGSQKHRVNVLKASKAGKPNDDDVNSVMSSTFLPTGVSERADIDSTIDETAEEEFAQVVDSMKGTTLEENEPVSRRPTRPHHSSNGEGPRPHPLSPETSGVGAEKTNGEIPKEVSLRQCLFCTASAGNLEENLAHMQKDHGMFIPERAYLVDLEGLVEYLSKKVHDGYQCLYCGRLKWSEDGIKTHMRDMSHCKIAYETEQQQLDIGQFYDFRSTYSDSGVDTDEDVEMESAGGEAQGGGVKLGAKRVAQSAVQDGDQKLPDSKSDEEGWETDSTVSDVPSDEIGAMYYDDRQRVQSNLQRRHTDTLRHRSADGFHSHAHATPHTAYYDDFELHLPTGRVAGHRSLNRYYRQNLRNYPTPEERAQRLITAGPDDSGSDEALPDGNAQQERGRDRNRQLVSRANGGLGMFAVTADKKRQVVAVERREQKRNKRAQAKLQWKTDFQANNQKYYRDPLLGRAG